jgi:outer membrane protein OmpA-like peptidoglycan-associated protein
MKKSILFVFCYLSLNVFGQQFKYLIMKDKESGQTLNEVNISFKEKISGSVVDASTDSVGVVSAALVKDKKYVITTSKIGYDPEMIDFTPKNDNVTIDVKIRKTGSGVMIRLENVVYAYDKAILNRSGKNQLDTLFRFLKENKKVQVELNSHTDSRGSAEYNLNLSKNRSLSCNNYLRSKGLKFNRIMMNNFGESKLVNHCSDGVECSEDLHQVNRRTEFVILFPKN